jgi:hypothetical protein
MLLLYDVSSSDFEGKTCPLAARGYSRDERRSNLQIIYGLLCDRAGVPIATEVFEGSTVERQVAKVKDRFGLERVVLISESRDGDEAESERARRGLASIGSPR